MPFTTDPVPDEDIREGFMAMRRQHKDRRREEAELQDPEEGRNYFEQLHPLPTQSGHAELHRHDRHHNNTEDKNMILSILDSEPPLMSPAPLQSQRSKSISDLIFPEEHFTRPLLNGDFSKPFLDDDDIAKITGDNMSSNAKTVVYHVNSREVNKTSSRLSQRPPTNSRNNSPSPHHPPPEKKQSSESLSVSISSTIVEGGGVMHGDQNREGMKQNKAWYRTMSWWVRPYGYKVSTNLKNDWKVQAAWFSKISLIKAIQLLAINVWLTFVAMTPKLKAFVVDNHDWMFVGLLIFLSMILIIRAIARRNAAWYFIITLVSLFGVIVPIAFTISTVTFTYNAYCIPIVTGTLFLVFLTLPFVPFMLQTPVTKPGVLRTGAVLILIYAILILIVVAYANYTTDMTKFATVMWFPGLLMAEIVLWVTIYEIQRILNGLCFNVSERRWAVSALYV